MRASEFMCEGETLFERPRGVQRRSSSGGFIKGALGIAGAAALGMGAANHIKDTTASGRVNTTAPTHQSVNVNGGDQEVLAKTIWGEARNQGEDGMRAVGHVIVNRANSGLKEFPSSVKGVATQRHQFSAWNHNDPNARKMQHVDDLDPNGDDYKAYQTAYQVAGDILNGNDADNTDGALYYHTTAVHPRWARNADPIKKIASHIFYKNVNNQS